MPSHKHNFKAALAYLDKFQFHGFRLGLERMTGILNAFGNPEKSYPCLQVAGTNGKGSVSAIIASILHAVGYRTGLYTSPHLSSLRERFRIGNTMIPEEELKEQIWRIKDFLERGAKLSYFEFTTAIAMVWFAEQGADLVIFETGLGGRLDATNIVTPLVSVITNISLEHQAFLGSSISEIAREKAGIIKKDVPVITGVGEQPALSVILDRCFEMNAPVWELGRDFNVEEHGNSGIDYKGQFLKINGLYPALRGRHQAVNAGLAIAACERLMKQGFRVTDTAVRNGCRDVYWPGRGELLKGSCRVLLDGAHNLGGLRSLKDLLGRLNTTPEDRDRNLHTLLWACSDEGGDKDFVAMLRQISSLFRQIIITEPPGPRVPVTLERWRGSDIPKDVTMKQDWKKALNKALLNCGKKDMLCVAGSLYLVGAVREELMERKFVCV
ncbi:MAG: folylpolyglutamate synthase/dihydrofolate synthase family protein [Thermodesulfobacteriota bacterium]|nr:folylpolyglutamate synthase/dihydrofolate synthase family protein [Thermodesulfobacteriota bacterium]